MTISRIFSSFYNSYPQAETPAEAAKIQIPIQETAKESKVHTWHLVDRNKVYLMRNNGKLECHFVTSNGAIIINDIDPPASFTQERAIHFLLELCPSLSESGHVEFLEYGEEIHTWHLKDGRKAHLIRNNEQLECYIINDKETVISQIDPPDWLTPEEAINRLLEMYPILHKDNSVTFIENQEKLYTWEVKYENPVTLFRLGEEIKYRTIYAEKEVIGNALIPDRLSLSEGIEWIKKRYPHVYPRKEEHGKKSCYVKFKEKVIDQKSALDEKLFLDMNHWCVTLMNADNSNKCPCTWMGHASLVIETVEEEGYFIRSAHLIKTAEGKADIIFSEVSRKNLINWAKKVSKSETWSRPKEDIQRMIDQIFLEVTHQKNGDPLIFFSMRGDNLSFWERFFTKETYSEYAYDENPFNCIKYSHRNLRLANIEPILRSGCTLSNKLLQTPVLYVGSRVKAVAQETFLTALYIGINASMGTIFSTIAGYGLFVINGGRFVPVLPTIENTNAMVRSLMRVNKKSLISEKTHKDKYDYKFKNSYT